MAVLGGFFDKKKLQKKLARKVRHGVARGSGCTDGGKMAQRRGRVGAVRTRLSVFQRKDIQMGGKKTFLNWLEMAKE